RSASAEGQRASRGRHALTLSFARPLPHLRPGPAPDRARARAQGGRKRDGVESNAPSEKSEAVAKARERAAPDRARARPHSGRKRDAVASSRPSEQSDAVARA